MKIDITGLHIEPTNICTLKCAGCARTRFINQWPQHWQNHSIDIDSLMEFIDVDIAGKNISLCGNYGDPIYHPDLPILVRNLKSCKSTISITTNGSHRKAEWWQDLCRELDDKDRVIFSIDGLPDTFTQYRKNADWNSIEIGIKTCVAARVQTVWKYIPFSFNQTDIESAEHISQDLGMSEFVIRYSDRFDKDTQHLIPDQTMLGTRWRSQQSIKNNSGDGIIVSPKCYHGKEHFISADGYYSPCCYIADHRFYYKTDWGKSKKEYDITKISLSEILNRPKVLEFYQNIPENPSLVCQFSCPKAG